MGKDNLGSELSGILFKLLLEMGFIFVFPFNRMLFGFGPKTKTKK